MRILGQDLMEQAKVLRLCSLLELRSLQNEINEIVKMAQVATADAKVDFSLGAVGR